MHQSAQIVATKYRDKAVAARYGQSRYSDFQGRINNFFAWRAVKRALGAVPAGGKVLDIPCGTGRFSWHLARAGWKTVASDTSEEMMDVGRALGHPGETPKPEFFQRDVFKLPYPDGHFDAAVCIRLFNLLDRPDRIRALLELTRVARTVVASYYHPYTFKRLSCWVRHKLGLRRPLKPRVTATALREELEAAGVKVHRRLSVVPLLSEEWLVVVRRP
jgi:ubiquinone/menaquinone biosynthesis C-methylase UbiE